MECSNEDRLLRKQQFPRSEMSLNGFSWDNSGQVFRAQAGVAFMLGA